MPKVFKVYSGPDLVKELLSFGFEIKYQKGSHIKLIFKTKSGEKVAMVPNHKTLKQGTMISIYKNILEIEEIDVKRLNSIFRN